MMLFFCVSSSSEAYKKYAESLPNGTTNFYSGGGCHLNGINEAHPAKADWAITNDKIRAAFISSPAYESAIKEWYKSNYNGLTGFDIPEIAFAHIKQCITNLGMSKQDLQHFTFSAPKPTTHKKDSCGRCGNTISGPDKRFWIEVLDKYGCPKCIKNWNKSLFAATDKHYAPRNNIVSGERTIGWELECNPTIKSVYHLWKKGLCLFTEDGSLRGSNPVELVTPVLSESTWHRHAKSFFSGLDAKIYQRAGLHLWIGTKDMSWRSLFALWIFIHRNRTHFFAMCPPCRFPISENRNDGGPRHLPVPPSIKQLGRKKELLALLYGTLDLRGPPAYHKSRMQCSKRCNDKEQMYNGGVLHRYQWVNIHGHFFRRAIEIRIHAATTQLWKFEGWARMWMEIVNKCACSDPAIFSQAKVMDVLSIGSRAFMKKRIGQLKQAHLSNGKISSDWYNTEGL